MAAAGGHFPSQHRDPSPVSACIAELVEVRLLARSHDRVVLTRRGRLLGNEVAARLLAALEQARVVAGTR